MSANCTSDRKGQGFKSSRGVQWGLKSTENPSKKRRGCTEPWSLAGGGYVLPQTSGEAGGPWSSQLPVKTSKVETGSGLRSTAQKKRLKNTAQAEMVSVKNELHPGDAKLEQGRS